MTASPFTQRRVLLVIAAAVCITIALGYWLFLRTDYAVLYTQLKPTDASAIVAELDAKGIAHRLRDDGTTILVPADQADSVKLDVAGSDIPLKGSVGFELFNKSDMGLTDFAQKINYQRALQGELARSIMMMDGVDDARVHLAIPERSLFRGSQSPTKAAVEVIAKLGQTIDADRVAGIQQLVASAVPDLNLSDVVVLDGDGRIVSQPPASEASATPEDQERTATQDYYSARAKAALATLMPGLQFDIHTLVMPNASGSSATDADESAVPADAAATTTGSATGTAAAKPAAGTTPNAARDFQLRVTVVSAAALNSEDQALARNAVASAVGLDEHHGDDIVFQVGPLGTASTAPAYTAPPIKAVDAAVPENGATPLVPAPVTPLWWWLIAGLAAAGAAALFTRTRTPDLSRSDRALFVERLKRQLAGRAMVDDARA